MSSGSSAQLGTAAGSAVPPATSFDQYAEGYGEALAQGLRLSGESQDYFARRRVAWLLQQLRALGEHPRCVMDFGCGTGSSVREFLAQSSAESVLGVDVSLGLLTTARAQCASDRATFALRDDAEPVDAVDLAFCNGVFHHIPPAERPDALAYIHRALRPGGLFALWENNPWNPGTRLVMSRIPFDRDAITLTPPEARAAVRAAGFDAMRTDFLFIFPRLLRRLRPLESRLSRWPLGGQYQVLCRKR
jgi:SAM-dependent methyltransferase